MAISDRVDEAVAAMPFADAPVKRMVVESPGWSSTSFVKQELVADADSAMYQAKERGRGRLVVGGRHGSPAVGVQRHLESEISRSLELGELRVFYQPIVAVNPQHPVVAVEALLRWQHPRHGLLSAEAFIGLAERCGARGAIGRWVVDQACRKFSSWQSELGDRAPERVFVSLSPREISDSSLDVALAEALNAHGVPARSRGLELVEYDFTDSLLAPRLAEHRDRGHPLAVDDFGTGYSSLSRLVDFPIDYAKIDRSFVQGLPNDQRRRTLIEAVANVAYQLGLIVIAEGVETEEQVIDLRAAGCDLLQGYHIGRSQPGQILTTSWLAARSTGTAGPDVDTGPGHRPVELTQ